jgi:hypothetical protein
LYYLTRTCGDPFERRISAHLLSESGIMNESLTFALQALLIRHEAYMVEAEQSRLEMSARIESLEIDKKKLEADNAKTIQENRGLLNQLEDLNSSVTDSEHHVKSLEATLQSTQQELRRLEGLAQRTHDLEVQLSAIEQEQVVLQQTVATTKAEERSAIQRWKKAERRLYEVQEQLEKIEREAREERERHVEVLGRMERQRTVEKELESAAGRLKGAAAATSLGQGKNGSNVVSHFVKDILQDNANLQMGIVELREMLMNSNEEVQTLREQLMLHQPMFAGNDDTNGQPTLRAELAPKEPQVVSQELHVHHHYHVPAKREEIRKPKKKRTIINPALFTPPNGSQSPRTPRARPIPLSTATAILSHTSISVPPPLTPNKRWSAQSGQTVSDFAPSSAPSSPHSIYRNSGVFDHVSIDQALDSRPTSPGSSVSPLSPDFQPYHRKRGSEHSTRSLTVPTAFRPSNVIHEEEDDDVEDLPDLHLGATDEFTTLEEVEQSLPSIDLEEPSSIDDPFSPFDLQPTLRRSASHESILSISGIDIHTLKSRPSQLTITGSSAILRPRTRPGQFAPVVSFASTGPITSSSTTIARPTISRNGHDSTSYLRSSMGLAERPASRSSNGSSEGQSQGTVKGIGGWVWSRWGVSPTPTVVATASRSVSAPRIPDPPCASAPTGMPAVDPLKAFMGRAPGVNQKGPILGLKRPERTPSKVVPERVDTDALREVLME